MLCVERVADSPFFKLFEPMLRDDFHSGPQAHACHGRAHLPLALASRLHTASLHDLAASAAADVGLRGDPYTILVTREWPIGLAEHAVDDWWPTLAPTPDLLQTPRLDPDIPTSQSYFAARYARQLDALPRAVHLRYLLRLGLLFRTHDTVALISCERSRAHRQQRTQREILRGWFLGEAEPARGVVAA